MVVNVAWKWRVGAYPRRTGCSTCKFSPREGISAYLNLPTTKCDGMWDIPLPLVVVKRHAKVRHEGQHLPFEVTKPEQQVHRGRLLRTTAFFLCTLDGEHGTWVGLKARPDYGIIARRKGRTLRMRQAHLESWGPFQCCFGLH